METQTFTISHYHRQPFIISSQKRSYILRCCVRSIVCVLEIMLGLLLGGLTGWAIGWRVGAAYTAIFEPSHLLTFEETNVWYYMPVTFANYSLLLGAVIGVLVVRFYSLHLLKDRIVSLYENGHTEPRQLAHVLYQDEGKVKSIIYRLIQKGKLSYKDDSCSTNVPHNYCGREHKMKKINTICVALLSVFFLFGCLPSVHPLYTKDTLVFDEQLVGKWYGDDGGIWSFAKAGDKKYELKVLDDEGKQASFEVHLVQLGEYRFIDLYPGKNMDLKNTAEIYNFNLVPAHTFMKTELSDDNLRLQWVYLGELIEDDPNLLKHEIIDEEKQDGTGDCSILITAKSEDIQRVLLQNLEKVLDEDNDGEEFRRCPSVFSEKDINFDPKLIGQWESAKGQYIDIIEWETGAYDIVISDEPEECREFKAILYMLDNRCILGLYSGPPSKKEEAAGLHLIPDSLMLVEQVEPELKLRPIDWEEMDEVSQGKPRWGFDEFSRPDYVFHRVAF